MTAVRAGTWTSLAEALAEQLTACGALRSPAWRAALCSVPRHALVPSFFRQDSDAAWVEVTGSAPDYLTEVYANQPLITSLTDDESGPEPASSSSQPSLMIRMLEALDLHDDDRVLEIGTGTGYNAGLQRRATLTFGGHGVAKRMTWSRAVKRATACSSHPGGSVPRGGTCRSSAVPWC